MLVHDIIKNLNSKDMLSQKNALEQIQILIQCFTNKISTIYDGITQININSESNLIALIPVLLDTGSDKTHQLTVDSICEDIIRVVNPYAFESVFAAISTVFQGVKFQSKILGLKMICKYAEIHPSIISSNLYLITESLISLASEPKKEIKVAVQECWVSICKTIENVDIQPIISVMIDGYMNPSTKTEIALEALASTPFVNDIDIPTLSLLIPMLVRAMREKKVVCQRKAAVVMDTLCKLIKNPVYARIFYEKLTWILDKGINEIAIEEVRNVCSRSKTTLNKVYEQANTKLVDSITRESCFYLYKDEILKIDSSINSNNLNLEYTISLVLNLVKYEIRDPTIYQGCIDPYLSNIILDKDIRETVSNTISKTLINTITVYEYDPEDNEENLCDCMFSLAYGTRVLLHQTPLKLKLNHTYGILGHNGAGKSTLLRAMANKTLQGFPDIEATYIEHHIPEDKHDTITLDYIANNPKIQAKGISREEISQNLAELYVTEHMMNSPLSTLSGGNVQRVNLILAKLAADPLILMDEPTNHIDALSIIWLKNYIKTTQNTTFLIISHDIKFMDEVCTNMIHYETLKLKVYRGNVTEFVKQKPEAAFYFQTTSQEVLSFSIPDPGPLEGVKSLTKSVLSMKNCYFQYPTAPKPQLSGITVQVSQAARIIIAGVNGAGKSTLVKILVGELEPNGGIIDRHPNLRMAYIPQNISASLDPHKQMTPIEYVMWRYRLGSDREQANKNALILTDEEIEAIKQKAQLNKTFIIKELTSRRAGKREHEYEAKSDGKVELVQWFSKGELIEMGYEKIVKEFDEKLAMESMMGQRKLTTGEIQKHMNSFGLEPEIAQHTKINALSSGQKMRCYLAASTFYLPHVVIFDEPTNFLDRESTNALSDAIKNFKGGVLVISHNDDFYNAITREKWLLENGSMTVFGDNMIEALEKERKKKEKEDSKKLNLEQAEDKFDSLGNKIEEKPKEKKELTRDEKKRLIKQRKEMQKAGIDTYDIDILLEG
jgi:elongation factor 3